MRRVGRLLRFAIVATMLLGASVAHAAFPGHNGKIAFEGLPGYPISAIYPNGTGITLLAQSSCLAHDPNWSANGAKFTWTRDHDCESSPQVWTANADGSGHSFVGLGSQSAWSPDGTKLVFFREGFLWTMNADGTNRVQIPNSQLFDQDPSWSPDGSKIAFRSGVTGEGIATIKPDGTDRTILTSGTNDREPGWSPDGTKLVFTRNGVWTMNADGTGQTQIVVNGFGASWSPDGSRIAYIRSADNSLHTVNTDGTGDRLVLDEYPDGETDWQPCPTACPPPTVSYDAPAQAFRLTVSLVPNFRQTISSTQCQARGGSPSSHGPPLSFSSCNPPGFVPGTVAHLGAGDNAEVQIGAGWGDESAANGNQADVGILAQINDVKTAGGAPYDPNPGFPGDDITLVTKLRLTDTNNGTSQNDPATVRDFEIFAPGRCEPFPGAGSHCLVSTTVNAVTPGVVTEQKQTVLQVFRVRVNDSGANGVRGDADDRTFATQGIYIP